MLPSSKPAEEDVAALLKRLVTRLVSGDVPAEVEARVKHWTSELKDDGCMVCGDMVPRLKDKAWWEGRWPEWLRLASMIVWYDDHLWANASQACSARKSGDSVAYDGA